MTRGLFNGFAALSDRSHEPSSEARRNGQKAVPTPRDLLALVRPPPPRAAVARQEGRTRRPVPGLALRGHAAADHREGGRSLLCALPRALSDRRRACRGAAGGCAASSGPGSAITRAPATCMPAPRRWSNSTAANFPAPRTDCGRCPASAPIRPRRSRRSRSISRESGRWQHRARHRAPVRRRGGIARRQAAHPRARRETHAATPRGRFRAGHDGSRRHDLHAEEAGLRALSVDGACAARERGDQESFPRKAEKKTGALRRGAAFVAVRADGFLLVRTRPEKGLLGGMTEVPTTDWHRDFDDARRRLRCRAAQGKVAPHARRGHAHLHAFSARTCRVPARACRRAPRRLPGCAGYRFPACTAKRCPT